MRGQRATRSLAQAGCRGDHVDVFGKTFEARESVHEYCRREGLLASPAVKR